MKPWLDELTEILRFVALKPPTTPELIIYLILAVGMSSFVLIKVAKAFSYHMADMTRTLVVVLTSSVVAIIIAVVLNIYVAPKIDKDLTYTLIMIGAMLFVVLAIAGVMCKFILKGPYIQGVISFICGIAAGVALLFLVQGIGDAVRKGGEDFKKTKKRTEDVNKDLESASK